MNQKRLKKLLSLVVVVGQTKKSFWRKSKNFELHVYYTPIKNIIIVMNIEGVDLDYPKLDVKFTVGDDIKLVIDWIERNGHEVSFIRNRI